MQSRWRVQAPIILLVMALLVLALLSFGIGRYAVDPLTVLRILAGQVTHAPASWTATQQAVILRIRPPRILAAVLVGAALSSSGAAYQTMFRNPLASPEILGVAAGAGFGASVGILLGLPADLLQILSFAFGLLAALLALAIGRAAASGSLIVLVLGGIVIGAIEVRACTGYERPAGSRSGDQRRDRQSLLRLSAGWPSTRRCFALHQGRREMLPARPERGRQDDTVAVSAQIF